MSDAIIQIEDLKKAYANGVEALKGVDLDIRRGEIMCGPSASRSNGNSGRLKAIACLRQINDGVPLSTPGGVSGSTPWLQSLAPYPFEVVTAAHRSGETANG